VRIRSVLLAVSATPILLSAGASAEEGSQAAVEDGKAISIEYTLTLDDGSTVDTNVGRDPLVYVQGGGQILPALEQALQGMHVADVKQVKLDVQQGYGAVNPDAFQKVEPEAIPEDARHVGAQLVAQDAGGRQQPVRVHEVTDEEITLDMNHPLAGRGLTFDVKILAIEDATAP
jgi:FKBP-type peptidyl-prolyl cis-trans isomerase 2